jgi:hypothetical protein
MPLHLPDVSEFQANVDWPKLVARNGGAAIIRAYSGFRPDHMWPGRRAAAEAAGVRILGIYAYLVPSRDPISQAEDFCGLVGALKYGQFAMADYEDQGFIGRKDNMAWLAAWYGHVDQRLSDPRSRGAWHYGGYYHAQQTGTLPVFDSPRRSIVAAYRANLHDGSPVPPHTAWQHTDRDSCGNWLATGIVTGTTGCDCNVIEEVDTVDQVLAQAYKGAAPPAQPAGTPPPPRPANRFAGWPTLAIGNTDTLRTKALQFDLNLAWKANILQVDGVYGAATRDRVADFQRFFHLLPVDGIAGPQTLATLDWRLDQLGIAANEPR